MNDKYDMADDTWRMVLSQCLANGYDIDGAIVAANKAVVAHRELFKGND